MMNSSPDPVNRLETVLRRASSNVPPPSDLHHSIMQAVRKGAASGEPTVARRVRPALAVPALALLVALSVWWAFPRQPAPPDILTMAAATLEQGRAIPQDAQIAILAPLSQEMELLNQDLQNAVAFLVASLP